MNINEEETHQARKKRDLTKHNFQVAEIQEKSRINSTISIDEEIKEDIKAQSDQLSDLYSRHSSVLNI